jgi:hypothetical protein
MIGFASLKPYLGQRSRWAFSERARHLEGVGAKPIIPFPTGRGCFSAYSRQFLPWLPSFSPSGTRSHTYSIISRGSYLHARRSSNPILDLNLLRLPATANCEL